MPNPSTPLIIGATALAGGAAYLATHSKKASGSASSEHDFASHATVLPSTGAAIPGREELKSYNVSWKGGDRDYGKDAGQEEVEKEQEWRSESAAGAELVDAMG
ncbi:hypothetical protein HK097_000473 [Rhizophlyctis rosea]|uniref:Uncharacterized protein n=1 Tax=Rhizophlyctis rosea TaxID=64517 RepID=A0AAD5S5F7_9FUNG|nr:hypothetical protein HK097_000473 [Rhizophlyctis rosea]